MFGLVWDDVKKARMLLFLELGWRDMFAREVSLLVVIVSKCNVRRPGIETVTIVLLLRDRSSKS